MGRVCGRSSGAMRRFRLRDVAQRVRSAPVAIIVLFSVMLVGLLVFGGSQLLPLLSASSRPLGSLFGSALPAPTPTPTIPPAAPSDLSTRATAATSVALTWKDNAR